MQKVEKFHSVHDYEQLKNAVISVIIFCQRAEKGKVVQNFEQNLVLTNHESCDRIKL